MLFSVNPENEPAALPRTRTTAKVNKISALDTTASGPKNYSRRENRSTAPGLPARERSVENMPARFAHEPQIERKVVQAGDLSGHHLAGYGQMPQISLRVGRVDETGRAGSIGEKSSLHFTLRILTMPSVVNSMPLRPLRVGHHAVEHVDSPLDALQQIGRRAHAHQIAGFVAGQQAVKQPRSSRTSPEPVRPRPVPRSHSRRRRTAGRTRPSGSADRDKCIPVRSGTATDNARISAPFADSGRSTARAQRQVRSSEPGRHSRTARRPADTRRTPS